MNKYVRALALVLFLSNCFSVSHAGWWSFSLSKFPFSSRSYSADVGFFGVIPSAIRYHFFPIFKNDLNSFSDDLVTKQKKDVNTRDTKILQKSKEKFKKVSIPLQNTVKTQFGKISEMQRIAEQNHQNTLKLLATMNRRADELNESIDPLYNLFVQAGLLVNDEKKQPDFNEAKKGTGLALLLAGGQKKSLSRIIKEQKQNSQRGFVGRNNNLCASNIGSVQPFRATNNKTICSSSMSLD